MCNPKDGFDRSVVCRARFFWIPASAGMTDGGLLGT